MRTVFNGNLPQSGRGHVFEGVPYQKGHGLGSFFKGVLRMLVPMAKQAGKALGKQALKTGVEIGSDYLQGEDLEKAVKTRGKQAGKRVGQKIGKVVKKKLQRGKGLGRKPKKHTIKGRRKKKSDILGTFVG